MTTKQISINVYDKGDVIDISGITASIHKNALNNGKRAVVLSRKELKNGQYTYSVLTDNGEKVSITPEQMRGERYIGVMDMSLLFD